ncbi:MAG: hypothetical protein JWP58_2012 [Hymenobacter sp.]|nr:hypothetical protein [Hymenobacter sp.]
MEKSWPLFLSLLLAPALGRCQPVPARPGATQACGSKHYQDSLVAKYIDHGAQRFSYNDPRWTQYCDSLIAICPNIAVAYQQKAVPLIKDGKYEVAFALENKAAELEPQQWLAYRGFLKCIFTKDYAGAISDFQQIERLLPNGREMDHTYAFFEGLCQLELGNYPQAETCFRHDVQLQRGADGTGDVHFNTLFYLGVLNLEMKRYEPAKTALAQCLKAYAQHPEANYYLGLVHRAQGNTEAAKRSFLAAQQALAKGYALNEDNIYYANYPRQITAYEVQQALR